MVKTVFVLWARLRSAEMLEQVLFSYGDAPGSELIRLRLYPQPVVLILFIRRFLLSDGLADFRREQCITQVGRADRGFHERSPNGAIGVGAFTK